MEPKRGADYYRENGKRAYEEGRILAFSTPISWREKAFQAGYNNAKAAWRKVNKGKDEWQAMGRKADKFARQALQTSPYGHALRFLLEPRKAKNVNETAKAHSPIDALQLALDAGKITQKEFNEASRKVWSWYVKACFTQTLDEFGKSKASWRLSHARLARQILEHFHKEAIDDKLGAT